MTEKIRFATLNVRGLGEHKKHREVFNLLKVRKIHVALLQETHSCENFLNRWRTEWGGNIFCAHGTTLARGVAVLIQRNIKVNVLEVRRDEGGRWILIRLELNGERMLISSIYGPNRDDPEFFVNLFNKIDETGEARKIVGGDFNLILDNSIDRRGEGMHKHENARKTVVNSLEILDLIDIWREKYEEKPGFTWRRSTPRPIQERLDFFLLTEEMTQFLENLYPLPGYRSDHDMVILDISFEISKRGPGYWKFNTSLLRDKDFVEGMNKLLEIELGQNYYTSKRMKWETTKQAIRQSSMQYAARKHKDRKNRLEVLTRKLKKLNSQEEECGILLHKNDHRIALNKEINDIQAYRTQGAMLRCKAEWLDAEKPTKYFFNLEKARFNKCTLQRIETDTGSLTSNPKTIQHELDKFYKKLYSEG